MLLLLSFGIPLFFLPFTEDYYDTAKWTVLAAAALCLFLLLAAKPFKLSLRPTTIALGALSLAALISLAFASPNKIEGLVSPFGPVTFLSLTVVSLFPSSRKFLWALFGSSAVLGLIAVYQFIGIAKRMMPDVGFLADPLWTPTGSAVATLAILTITLPILIQGLIEARKEKRDGLLALGILMILPVALGIVLLSWQLVPKLSTTLLSPREGWSVMLEILKNPQQAIVGVGAENFLTAFTAGRPARLNLSHLWRARFTTNANFLFHITTIYGLIGTASCLLFLKGFLTRKRKDTLFISLFIGFLSLLLAPPNLSLLVVVTGLLIVSEEGKVHFGVPFFARLLVSFLAFAGLLLLGRAYAAEVDFGRSLVAAQQKDGRATYNLQFQAIRKNPKISRFHIAYSQTNLALAASLASQENQENDQKTRQLMQELIQQAVNEAKLAVNLNPANILAWENLARTYQQLMRIADGMDTWAATTYRQAIVLDPYNPLLAVELGGVYIQMKNYTDAITQFTRATNLKPDYANAWYNLANVYELNGDNQQAIDALEKTVSLVDPSSSDYPIVTQKLEDLRAP